MFPQIIQCNTPFHSASQKPKRKPYLHQHIVPRLSSDPEPTVSGILHLYIREYHLKVSIIPATQVSGRAFTELQKEEKIHYKTVSHQSLEGINYALCQTPRVLLTEHPLTKESLESLLTTGPPTRAVHGTQQKSNKVSLTLH